MVKGAVGEQLKLFMTPSELMNYATPYDKADIETPERMWARKEGEARETPHWSKHGSGVYDSIAKEGVTSHVSIWHDDEEGPGLMDGHHRVAAAAAVERYTGRQQFIPLDHEGANAAYGPGAYYEDRYPQNVRKNWKGSST